MKREQEKYFISRHAHPERDLDKWTEKYTGLNEYGVNAARERAKDLINEIENLPKGSVTWLAGCSETPRTRSTLTVYGEEIKKHFQDSDDVLYLGKEDIFGKSKEIIDLIKNTKDKKIIVDFPLSLKEISNREMLDNVYKGTWNKEIKQLFLDSGKNMNKFTESWFDEFSEEKEGSLKSPQQSFRQITNALRRLQEFFDKIILGRDSLIVVSGHSTEINSLVTKLVGGKITAESFRRNIKDSVQETESLVISRKKDKTSLKFRDNKYDITKHI